MKFFLFSIILLYFQTLSAKTIEVCEKCEFTSIKEAIQNSKNDDVIYINKGEYAEGQIVIQ